MLVREAFGLLIMLIATAAVGMGVGAVLVATATYLIEH